MKRTTTHGPETAHTFVEDAREAVGASFERFCLSASLSKSAVSRRFVALSAARMADWMTADLSGLDLLVIQIVGLHLADDRQQVA